MTIYSLKIAACETRLANTTTTSPGPLARVSGGGSEDAAKLEGRNAPVVCEYSLYIIRGLPFFSSAAAAAADAPLANWQSQARRVQHIVYTSVVRSLARGHNKCYNLNDIITRH